MFCPGKEVMHHLLQTDYPAADVYPFAALHSGWRIFRQCKAALWAAPQPNPAFPTLRVGRRERQCICDLSHPADGR